MPQSQTKARVRQPHISSPTMHVGFWIMYELKLVNKKILGNLFIRSVIRRVVKMA